MMPMATPEAQREYQRKWKARRRADFFADKCCVRCGSTERLELDHKDPKLKISHNIWSWSKERREAEIAKCQVLCNECHQVKTVENDEHPSGENHPRAVLSLESVIAIRKLNSDEGIGYRRIAERLGLPVWSVRDVVKNKTWRGVVA